jgi:hypothetical protein
VTGTSDVSRWHFRSLRHHRGRAPPEPGIHVRRSSKNLTAEKRRAPAPKAPRGSEWDDAGHDFAGICSNPRIEMDRVTPPASAGGFWETVASPKAPRGSEWDDAWLSRAARA